MESIHPHVGVGMIITNTQGHILVGKRIGSHAPYYSIPGGHLEQGESFEGAAVREAMEEIGIEITAPKVIAVTNNLETFHKEGKHTISIVLLVHNFKGVIQNCEPEKCEGWEWVDPHRLPEPHFEASHNAVACYLKGTCYNGSK